jgi:cellulose biosynthesis protein BcsQ
MNSYNVGLLETKLFNRVYYKESITSGRGVIEYTQKEKEKAEKAAEEMLSLYKEVKHLLNI